MKIAFEVSVSVKPSKPPTVFIAKVELPPFTSKLPLVEPTNLIPPPKTSNALPPKASLFRPRPPFILNKDEALFHNRLALC